MGDKEFQALVKKVVREHANAHLDVSDVIQISEDDVYIVWQVKVLQNNKALASTTLKDGMYYELTYDGDKKRVLCGRLQEVGKLLRERSG